MRWKLLVLGLFLLAIGLYDIVFDPFLGAAWYWLWLVIILVVLLWFYYAILMRRASIKVQAKNWRIQGPLFGFNISYGRIYAITSAQISQHWPPDSLKGSEKSLLDPFYTHTCLFIELTSYPGFFRWKELWFPRYVFGTSRPGILCVVEEWMNLSRDLEQARLARQERTGRHRRGESRSLAKKILEADEDF